MDIVLLKTFLAVARLRHFGKAAEALSVTQSAVSARIKLLESAFGVDLFERKRNDIQLTPAGQGLREHADVIVRSWARAAQELALGSRFAKSLAIGAPADLWSIWVRDWVVRLRRARSDLALHLDILPAETLIQRLAAIQLDLAFLFEPPQTPELVVEQVIRIPLVMFSTQPGLDAQAAVQNGYILVDWGTAFMINHSQAFPDLSAPGLRVSHGRMALDLLRCTGGSTYLAEQQAAEDVTNGLLHPVPGAPVIERLGYAVYRPESAHRELLRTTLDSTRSQGVRFP
jgi:DNA-binding transcriptional LysR family regulator